MSSTEILEIKEFTYALSFEIFGLPKLPNSLLGSHWRARQTEAKKWERLVWAKCWPLKPESPLSKATLTLTRCSSRAPDFDGLAGSFKHVIDGLVKAGVLTDDTPEIIGQPKYVHEKIGACKGKIKVEVMA